MNIDEAKQQFITSWGAFGINWGINKTMAQIHALLLVSPDPMSAEDIMDTLRISQGNANMNLRELISWGLIERTIKPGERKDFYLAEKDIWKVIRLIVKERKKRELEPMLNLLEQLAKVEDATKSRESKAFVDMINSIHNMASFTNSALDVMTKSEQGWFRESLKKLFS